MVIGAAARDRRGVVPRSFSARRFGILRGHSVWLQAAPKGSAEPFLIGHAGLECFHQTVHGDPLAVQVRDQALVPGLGKKHRKQIRIC
ncbi:MAG TPA: hypothetical protein VNZ94_17355 [Xanthobacteraceae bacterium]|nr:hypothetical protein [Xanthobacteraceae bacterium]